MATINYAAREISVKIVYYGPGLSGKTTNLQIIHRKIPQKAKSDMVSLATETDRTLFFDFLPLDLGKIRGFTTKFQLYTVPGQVYYNATRKLVLRGVDGIVFIADSAVDKYDENLESFDNMEENLAEYGYKRETIPIIIQYNKRDLPNAMPTTEINSTFNKYNLRWSEAVASKGKGVFESLKLIGKLVIDQLNQKYSSSPRKRQTSPVPGPIQKPMSIQEQIQPNFATPGTPPNYVDQNQQSSLQNPQPLTQSQSFQNDDFSSDPFASQPQQNQDEFMKFGDVNIEPMAPSMYSNDPVNRQPQTPPSQQYQSFQNERGPYTESPQQPSMNDPINTSRQNQYYQDTPKQNNQPVENEEAIFDPAYRNNDHFAQNPNSGNFSQNQTEFDSRNTYNNSVNTQVSNDIDDSDSSHKPMFFTSLNNEKQRKKGKKPINPKHKQKLSFFARLLKWLRWYS